MNGYGYLDEQLHKRKPTSTFTKLTVGEVVDTNDPQQMGRLRVVCPSLGDTMDTPIKNIPWASYVSPLGGMNETASRGRGEYETSGPISYGMWNIPKIGSTVLIACIDGDTRFRIWMGCLHGQFTTHTMPHGRYDYDGDESPSGPLSSTEDPIQPLYSELTLAFTKSQDSVTAGIVTDARKSYEFKTRGADFTTTAIDNDIVNSSDSFLSSKADNRDVLDVNTDGTETEITQGYAESRVEPPLSFSATNNKNYDSQVYNWTTPGFHSISMDDRPENCRIRIRTTHGHQIIMDDTNERMYISTPQGDTWIELDEKGNIDIYGKRNVSIHAEKDINMTTDKAFRVKAKEGIHLISEDEVRVHAKGGNGLQMKSNQAIHVESTLDTHIKANGNAYIETTYDMHVKAGNVLYLSSWADSHIDIGANGLLSTGGTLDILGGGDITMTGGPNVHINGPIAASATAATSAVAAVESFWTSRVPEHEPWARVMTKPTVTDNDLNNTHTNAAEFTYSDADVGRTERGESLGRNPKWRR